MNEPVLQLLGIARRAGALSLGHDAAIQALRGGKAELCLLADDASERLRREFDRAGLEAGGLPVIRTPFSMETLHRAIGYRAGVVAVTDGGFAKKLAQLLEQSKEEE